MLPKSTGRAVAAPADMNPGATSTAATTFNAVMAGGMDGRETIATNPPHPGDLDMYFNIDDNVAFGGNYTATFTFEYYGRGTGSFRRQYDLTSPQGGDLSGAYANGPPLQETDSGTWKTASFTVNNALFANRQNNSTDFRITSPDPFIIHSATVTIAANG